MQGKPKTVTTPPSEAVEAAKSALEQLASLRARMGAVREELDVMRERLEAGGKARLLSREAFAQAVGDALNTAAGARGVLAKITIVDRDAVLSAGGNKGLDAAIDHLSRWVTGHLRATDHAGHYGEGTVALWLGFADLDGASAKLDRLAARIEEDAVTDPKVPAYRLEITHDQLGAEDLSA